MIDGVVLTPQERVRIVSELKLVDSKHITKYKINLALTMAASDFIGRDYNIHNIMKRTHVNAHLRSVVKCNLMSGWRLSQADLSHSKCVFSAFTSLQQLNLSHNAITDLAALGLDACPYLECLDVRNNQIDVELTTLAQTLDKIPSLVIVALYGNPCMRSPADRLQLLSGMARLRQIFCTLRVCDTFITIQERLNAWAANGLSAADSTRIQAQMAINIRIPVEALTDLTRVLKLDLSGMDLTSNLLNSQSATVPLSKFTGLTHLCLARNQLTTVTGLGLRFCVNLLALDIRDNLLSDVASVMQVCSELPKLQLLALAGNKKLGDSNSAAGYRRRAIAAMPALMDPSCKLRYIDETMLTASEIADAFRNSIGALKAGRLQFLISLRRRLEDRAQAQGTTFELQHALSLEELDVSDAGIEELVLNPMARLRKLNLDCNRLTAAAILRSEMYNLRYLEVLSLRENQLLNVDVVGQALDMLPALRVLNLSGNRVMPSADADSRIALLTHMPRSAHTGFCLQLIDGQPISIAERVAAKAARDGLAHGSSSLEVETCRLSLVLEQLREPRASQKDLQSGNASVVVDVNELTVAGHAERKEDARTEISSLDASQLTLSSTELNLKNRSLAALHLLREFSYLQVLCVSDNRIKTLHDQGLELLPSLRVLDVRHNQLTNLADSMNALRACHSLSSLYLFQATGTSETDSPATYVHAVGAVLPGVRLIDDVPNPCQLTSFQRDAQRFLWGLAHIGPHQLFRCDLANLNLPTSMFFFVVAALQEIGLVTELHTQSNLWNTGADRVELYRSYLLYALGHHLKTLDDEAISEAELNDALQLIGAEQEQGTSLLIKGGWKACRQAAFNGALAIKGLQTPNHRCLLRGTAGANLSWYYDSMEGNAGDSDSDDEIEPISVVDSTKINVAPIELDSKSDADRPALPSERPLSQRNHLPASNVDAVKSPASAYSSPGSVAIKFEIIFHFFQLYALFLFIDSTIPWPSDWRNFSQFTYFFTMDWDLAFNFAIPNQRDAIVFGILMALPALLAICYYVVGTWKFDTWVRAYADEWNFTKYRAMGTIIFLAVVIFFVAVLSDYPTSFQNISSGQLPTTLVCGGLLFGWGLLLLFGMVWYTLVTSFRRNYIGRSRHIFLKFWNGRFLTLNRAIFFFLVLLWMPVARVLLGQFFCPSASNCFPASVTVLQVLAFIFGAIYLLALPVYLVHSIAVAVESVALQGYNTQVHEIETEVARLQAERTRFLTVKAKVQDCDHAIANYGTLLKAAWAAEVVKHELPHAYLYAAYEHRFRYYKMFHLFQKLAIVVITYFIPTGPYAYMKTVIGTGFQGVCFLVALVCRPFNDYLNDAMDVASQFANFITVLSGLGVSMGWMPANVATYLLFVFNGIAVLVFLIAISVSPARLCVAHRYVYFKYTLNYYNFLFFFFFFYVIKSCTSNY